MLWSQTFVHVEEAPPPYTITYHPSSVHVTIEKSEHGDLVIVGSADRVRAWLLDIVSELDAHAVFAGDYRQCFDAGPGAS